MYDVGEKKSFAKNPQNWNTNPEIEGVKSPLGRKFPATCRLTFVPTLPPIPLSPLMKAFSVVEDPSCALKKLVQRLPHATVSFFTCVTALAVPTLRLRLAVTTAAADTA